MRARKIPEELAAVAVYDGRTLLGHVVEQLNGQYEAGLSDGQSLGLYTSRQAAGHAIIEASHKGQRTN